MRKRFYHLSFIGQEKAPRPRFRAVIPGPTAGSRSRSAFPALRHLIGCTATTVVGDSKLVCIRTLRISYRPCMTMTTRSYKYVLGWLAERVESSRVESSHPSSSAPTILLIALGHALRRAPRVALSDLLYMYRSSSLTSGVAYYK
jgi:hypothetical protein